MTGAEIVIGTIVIQGWQAAAIIATVANLGLSYISGKALKAKMKDAAAQKALQTSIQSAIEPRAVVYGEARIGGPYVFLETRNIDDKDDAEDTNKWLHIIIALTAHPIEEIEYVYFDGKPIDIRGCYSKNVIGKTVNVDYADYFWPNNNIPVSSPSGHEYRGNLNRYIPDNEDYYTRFSGTNWFNINYPLWDTSRKAEEKATYEKLFKKNLYIIPVTGQWIYDTHSNSSWNTLWYNEDFARSEEVRASIQRTTTPYTYVTNTGTRNPTTTDPDQSGILPWNFNHRLERCSYCYIRLKFDKEVTTGIPEISFKIKGKRLYNPLADSTKYNPGNRGLYSGVTYYVGDIVTDGPGYVCIKQCINIQPNVTAGWENYWVARTHQLPDYQTDSYGTQLEKESTWIYSNNWALCVLDFLLDKYYGLRASTGGDIVELDWDSICKAVLDSYDGGYVFRSQGNAPTVDASYLDYVICDGPFTTDASPADILESLLAAGLGELAYSQGKHRLYAGVYTEPDNNPNTESEDNFDESYLAEGGIEVITSLPTADMYNVVTGTYIQRQDQDGRWTFESTEFDPQKQTTYIAEDGEEITTEISLPFIQEKEQAEKLATMMLEIPRRGYVIRANCNSKAWKYAVGDIVYVSMDRLGLTNSIQPSFTLDSSGNTDSYKQFKIENMSYNENGTIDLTMREHDMGLYKPTGIYANDPVPNTDDLYLENKTTPANPPTNLSATNVERVEPSGSRSSFVRLTFDGPNLKAMSPDWVQGHNYDYIAYYRVKYARSSSPAETTSPFPYDVDGDPWHYIDVPANRDFNSAVGVDAAVQSVDIFDMEPNETYEIAVRAVPIIGYPSTWSDATLSHNTPVFNTITITNVESNEVGAGYVSFDISYTGVTYNNLQTVNIYYDYASPYVFPVSPFPASSGLERFPAPTDDPSPTRIYFPTDEIIEGRFWFELVDTAGQISNRYPAGDVGIAATAPDATAGQDGISAFLTVSAANIPVDNTGTPISGAFDNANGNFKVYEGGVDETANWTFTELTETNCTGTVTSGGAYSVTAISDDTATYTMRASRSGYSNIDVSFFLTKAYAGADGISTTQYYIRPTNGTAIKNTDPITTLEVVAYKIDGGVVAPATSADGVEIYDDQNSPFSKGLSYSYNASEINGSLVVQLRENTSPFTVYDTITLADITDGLVAGYIETNNGLALIKQADSATVTPSSTTMTATFVDEEGTSYSEAITIYGRYSDPNLQLRWQDTTPNSTAIGNPVVTDEAGNPISESPTVWTTTNSFTVTFTFTSPLTGASTSASETVYVNAQGNTGASAKVLKLEAQGQSFSFDSSNTLIGPASIQFNASLENISTAVTWAIYDDTGTPLAPTSNYLNISGTNNVQAILYGANDPTYIDFEDITNNDFVRITATADGYSDSITVVKLTNGSNSLSGYLTNEAHVAPADNDGTNADLTDANGYFKVFFGDSEIAAGNTTVQVFDGTWGSSATKASGLTLTITDATDYYAASGTWNNSTDVEVFELRALYNGSYVYKDFTVTKSKAGGAGTSIRLNAEGFTFSYDNSTGSPVLIGPTDITLTCISSGITPATVSWSMWDDTGSPLSPASSYLTISGTNNETAVFAEFDSGNGKIDFSEITNNDFITIRATVGGFYDEVTIHKLVGGQDGAPGTGGVSAIVTNSSHTFTAENDGSVTDFTGSGTEIYVYEGVSALNFTTAGTLTADSTWRISSAVETPTNAITIGGITDGGTYAVVANHSTDTNFNNSDSIVIVYTIQYRLSDSTTGSFTAQQSFAKGKKGATGPAGGATLGILKNKSTFSTTNNGYVYLHGYDANGDPTDAVNGTVEYNGATETITNGNVFPGANGKYHILYDLVDDTRHALQKEYAETDSEEYIYYKVSSGTPNVYNPSEAEKANDIVIGSFTVSTGVVTAATVYTSPITIDAAAVTSGKISTINLIGDSTNPLGALRAGLDGETVDPSTLAGRWAFGNLEASGGFRELTNTLGYDTYVQSGATYTTVRGQLGRAFQVGGHGLKIAKHTDTSFNTYPQQTWITMFKLPASCVDQDRIIGKDLSDYWGLYATSTGGSRFYYGNGGFVDASSISSNPVPSVNFNKWHVLINTHNASTGAWNAWIFYPDGTYTEFNTAGSTNGLTADTVNARAVAIGANCEGDWDGSTLTSNTFDNLLVTEVQYYRQYINFSQAFNAARAIYSFSHAKFATLSADEIYVNTLEAITTISGEILTRALDDTTSGGGDHPVAQLTDSDTPLEIWSTTGAFVAGQRTSIFSITEDDEIGALINLRGTFADGSVNSAGMFTDAAIAGLRSRLGVSEPSQGSTTTGGYSYGNDNVDVSTNPATGTYVDMYNGGTPGLTSGTIRLGADDIAFTARLYDYRQQNNVPASSPPQWWQDAQASVWKLRFYYDANDGTPTHSAVGSLSPDILYTTWSTLVFNDPELGPIRNYYAKVDYTYNDSSLASAVTGDSGGLYTFGVRAYMTNTSYYNNPKVTSCSANQQLNSIETLAGALTAGVGIGTSGGVYDGSADVTFSLDTNELTPDNNIESTSTATIPYYESGQKKITVDALAGYMSGTIPTAAYNTPGYNYTVWGNITTSTAGWYTIAKNGIPPDTGAVLGQGYQGDRCYGKFIVNDTTSGHHQTVSFEAGCMYAQGAVIANVCSTEYSNLPIRGIRIIRGSTYDGAYLQVYLDLSCTITYCMMHDFTSPGWDNFQTSPPKMDTIPTGWTANCYFDLSTGNESWGSANEGAVVRLRNTGTFEVQGNASDTSASTMTYAGFTNNRVDSYLQATHASSQLWIEANSTITLRGEVSDTAWLTATPSYVQVHGSTGLYVENIRRNVNNSNLVLYGGSGNGGRIYLYGSTHATTPNRIYYDADEHNIRTTGATLLATFNTTASTFQYRVAAPLGSVSSCSYSFIGDNNTGFYQTSTNENGFSIAASGVQIGYLSGSTKGFYSSDTFAKGLGVSRDSAWTQKLVQYSDASGNWVVGASPTGNAKALILNATTDASNTTPTAGTNSIIMRIRNTTYLTLVNSEVQPSYRIVAQSDGTAAAPFYSFSSESSTGIYRVGTSELALVGLGSIAIKTQARNSTGHTTTGVITDHLNNSYDIGLNVLPPTSWNASIGTSGGTTSVYAQIVGKCWGTTSAGYDLYLPSSTNLDWPVGGVVTLINGGTSSMGVWDSASGITLYNLVPGTGRVAATSSASSIDKGGVATIWRYSASIYYMWGSEIIV